VQDRTLVIASLIVSITGFMLGVNWQNLGFVPEFISNSMPDYLPRFLAGYAFMNAGFMTGRPVVFALYSKLIPQKYQGTMLGWMVAGGSAARTIGPFVAVYLYYEIQTVGLNLLALFGSFVAFNTICLGLVYILWPQLLPAARRRDTLSVHRNSSLGPE
jgi:MFS family permease